MLPNLTSQGRNYATGRWVHLYRSIHNKFLKYEFIHIEDYNQMIKDMNLKIAEVETRLISELKKIQIGLSSHGHSALNAPAVPTPYISTYTSVTDPVVPVIVSMARTDSELMAIGPAEAPLSISFSADEQVANAKIINDIGI